MGTDGEDISKGGGRYLADRYVLLGSGAVVDDVWFRVVGCFGGND